MQDLFRTSRSVLVWHMWQLCFNPLVLLFSPKIVWYNLIATSCNKIAALKTRSAWFNSPPILPPNCIHKVIA